MIFSIFVIDRIANYGINRLSNKGLSWQYLINTINQSRRPLDSIPYPYIYEQLILGQNNSISECSNISFDNEPTTFNEETVTYTENKELIIKERLIEKIRNIGSNRIYELVLNKCICFITTNYDDNLLGSISPIDKSKQETKYSIRRQVNFTHDKTKKTLWKIHGDLDSPKSIMLGVEHYSGSSAMIYEYFNGTYKRKQFKCKSIRQKIQAQEYSDINSWIDLFFSANIHIIGLNLDHAESDIWYVLILRARLLKDSTYKGHIKNSIHFYYKEDEMPTCENLMEACGIILHSSPVENDDWPGFYKKIIDSI
ncbi:MAG: SIR2 family protein [Alistipes sp.]